MHKYVLVLFSILFSHISFADNDSDVWQALKSPGTIVVLRHSQSPKTIDPALAKIDSCAAERNLDEQGRSQAKAVGEAFKAHAISVGTVFSSPACRTRDTGILAFDEVENWEALKGSKADESLLAARMAEIKDKLQTIHEDKPIVLVTHGSVVYELVGKNLAMGEFAVLLPDANNSYTVVGSVLVPAQ